MLFLQHDNQRHFAAPLPLATTSQSGVLPVLTGNVGDVFRGDGTFAPIPTPTFQLHTAGVGLSGAPYNGSAAQTWTVDFTAVAAKVHTHPLADIQQSAALTNQVPAWNGGAWTPQYPLIIQDEGVLVGRASTINFVGGNVTASLAGEVATVVVTGPGGGGGGANLTAGTGLSGAVYNGSAPRTWTVDFTAVAAKVHTHPLADLTQSSAVVNQVPMWNGVAWTATNPLIAYSNGAQIGRVTGVNIIGTGATAAIFGGNRLDVTINAPTIALPIRDEGVNIGSATAINFTGAGVTATFAAGTATVTIPGTTLQTHTPGTGLTGGGYDGTVARTWQVDFTAVAAVNHTHPLSQIQQSAALTNQVPRWTGVAWTPRYPVIVQDEGVLVADAATFNFTGAGVTASVVGGVATINVPASSGAAHINGSGILGGTYNGSAAVTWSLDYATIAANHTHPLSQIQQSTATTGQAPIWNGVAWTAQNPVSAYVAGASVGRVSEINITNASGAVVVGNRLNLTFPTINFLDEGTALGVPTNVNFVGAGVTATFAAGTATVTIPGVVAGHTHPLSDITQSGAVIDQVPVWMGGAWTPQYPLKVVDTVTSAITRAGTLRGGTGINVYESGGAAYVALAAGTSFVDIRWNGALVGAANTINFTGNAIPVIPTMVGSTANIDIVDTGGGGGSGVNVNAVSVTGINFVNGTGIQANVSYSGGQAYVQMDSLAAAAGVTQIVAGSGIMVSPPSGTGVVTVSAASASYTWRAQLGPAGTTEAFITNNGVVRFTPGSNMNITANSLGAGGMEFVFDAVGGGAVTLQNAASAYEAVMSGAGSTYTFKRFHGTGGIAVTSDANNIIIDGSGIVGGGGITSVASGNPTAISVTNIGGVATIYPNFLGSGNSNRFAHSNHDHTYTASGGNVTGTISGNTFTLTAPTGGGITGISINNDGGAYTNLNVGGAGVTVVGNTLTITGGGGAGVTQVTSGAPSVLTVTPTTGNVQIIPSGLTGTYTPTLVGNTLTVYEFQLNGGMGYQASPIALTLPTSGGGGGSYTAWQAQGGGGTGAIADGNFFRLTAGSGMLLTPVNYPNGFELILTNIAGGGGGVTQVTSGNATALTVTPTTGNVVATPNFGGTGNSNLFAHSNHTHNYTQSGGNVAGTINADGTFTLTAPTGGGGISSVASGDASVLSVLSSAGAVTITPAGATTNSNATLVGNNLTIYLPNFTKGVATGLTPYPITLPSGGGAVNSVTSANGVALTINPTTGGVVVSPNFGGTGNSNLFAHSNHDHTYTQSGGNVTGTISGNTFTLNAPSSGGISAVVSGAPSLIDVTTVGGTATITPVGYTGAPSVSLVGNTLTVGMVSFSNGIATTAAGQSVTLPSGGAVVTQAPIIGNGSAGNPMTTNGMTSTPEWALVVTSQNDSAAVNPSFGFSRRGFDLNKGVVIGTYSADVAIKLGVALDYNGVPASANTYSHINFTGAGVSVSGNTVTILGGGGGGSVTSVASGNAAALTISPMAGNVIVTPNFAGTGTADTFSRSDHTHIYSQQSASGGGTGNVNGTIGVWDSFFGTYAYDLNVNLTNYWKSSNLRLQDTAGVATIYRDGYPSQRIQFVGASIVTQSDVLLIKGTGETSGGAADSIVLDGAYGITLKTPKLGFFNGSPALKQTVSAAATDAATTQALVNSLRSALIAYGLVA